MIPISEFSKAKGISEEKIISMIRDGFYAGRKVGDDWFVEEHERDETPAGTNKVIGPFQKGSLVGLSLSILFGLFTYPWGNPGFEGNVGYHMLMMIIVLPVVTLLCGIIFVVGSKFI